MKCPNCNETLVMADRQGVEIDYCPKCRGVWLDKGELDKIIERTSGYVPGPDMSREQPGESYKSHPHHSGDYNDPYYKNDPYYNKDDPRYRHKKKKGFLGDFFDFD